MSQGLTRYPAGSLREVLLISLPLILALVSNSLMLFADRLVLARHSSEVMVATVALWSVIAIFHYFPIGVVTILEVFVGRANGAGRLQRTGAYTWQMIWFAAATTIAYVPIAAGGSALLLHYAPSLALGVPYFRYLLYFGPIFSLVATLTAYFVGIGHIKLITFSAIGSNLLNIILDIYLVLNLGWGAKGAAIATGIAQLLQFVLLLLVFLRRRHREAQGTGRWHFHFPTARKMIKVGLPSATGHLVEIAAWALIMQILVAAGSIYVAVMAVGQTLFMLFSFFTEGLQKGVSTIAANLLGADREEAIEKLLRSAYLFLFAIMAILTIPLLFFPGPFVDLFLTDETFGARVEAIRCCGWVWGFMLFDGMVWILAGVITAGGDTRFVMIMNSLAAWLFAVLPIYLAINYLDASPGWAWRISLLYALINCICFYLRYRSGRWVRDLGSPKPA